jgi:predicted HD phosphohydrolase
MQELDAIIAKFLWVSLTEGNRDFVMGPTLLAQNPGKHMAMGDDGRLPKMPANPTLQNFSEYRFAPAQHLLQSAQHAQQSGCSEKVVLACLLHDIALLGFIRGDHGSWGAQLAEPYAES